MGRRTTVERVAHLLCELRVRLEDVGLTSGSAFKMPFTQAELADVVGVSPVHVNRTIKELRGTGLIQLADGTLTILDIPALESAAVFDPTYLRLA